MHRIVLAVVLSLAVALVPHGTTAQSAQQHVAGKLPSRGVLVVGSSLAGVSLGQTQAKVKALWGGRYTVCNKTEAPCPDPTWLYFYPSGTLVGAGVRFRDNKVAAVFTLGATPGWKSVEGATVADPASKVYELYGNPKYSKCIGYEALSVRKNGVVTSFYLTSGVIYGFAITAPGVTVCQ